MPHENNLPVQKKTQTSINEMYLWIHKYRNFSFSSIPSVSIANALSPCSLSFVLLAVVFLLFYIIKHFLINAKVNVNELKRKNSKRHTKNEKISFLDSKSVVTVFNGRQICLKCIIWISHENWFKFKNIFHI